MPLKTTLLLVLATLALPVCATGQSDTPRNGNPEPQPIPQTVVLNSPYGYGTAQRIYIEGRLLVKKQMSKADRDDNWLKNLWRSLKRLVNDEKKFTSLTLSIAGESFVTSTDDEGYFRLALPTPRALEPGWQPFSVLLEDGERIASSLLVVPEDNHIGIISDFDDTLVVSNVHDKKELLANSLLKNYLQRQVVGGMPALFWKIGSLNPWPESTPIFVVSASPRQISQGIADFLDYNGFPPGLVITKIISGERRDPLLDQKQYKIDKITEILQRLPTVRFVLIGDDGERDPESFAEIQKRYPERILAVWIHAVNPEPQRPRYENQVLFRAHPERLDIPVDKLSVTEPL